MTVGESGEGGETRLERRPSLMNLTLSKGGGDTLLSGRAPSIDSDPPGPQEFIQPIDIVNADIIVIVNQSWHEVELRTFPCHLQDSWPTR
jgi:hypothetical protein